MVQAWSVNPAAMAEVRWSREALRSHHQGGNGSSGTNRGIARGSVVLLSRFMVLQLHFPSLLFMFAIQH